jgi:nitrate reductase assembly molybdenum cofactor insertion protein NarJ
MGIFPMPEESSKQDAGLLYTLAERTTHLSASLEHLQALHEKGTEKVTQALKAVQDANRADTDRVVAALDRHLADDKASFEAHNVRLSVLENWKSNVMGRLTVAATVCGAAAALVGWALNKFF